MLTKLHFNKESIEKSRQYWIDEKIEEQHPGLKWHEPEFPNEQGFYYRVFEIHIDELHQTSLFEFGIDELKNVSYEDEYEAIEKCQYGVADNIEQIKEYFKDEIEDLNVKYAIQLDYVFQHKENAGHAKGTWRWHKWGPYIGKYEPMHEYLDDEDFGEDFQGYLILFHLKRLPKANQ